MRLSAKWALLAPSLNLGNRSVGIEVCYKPSNSIGNSELL